MSELRFAKIIDEATHEVQVGVGCQDEYYEEIGMTKMDVELAYNGLWYQTGYAPVKPAPLPPTNEEQRQNREAAYVAEVDKLHAQKMRHTVLGDWTEEDEANYVAEVKRLSEDINNRYPYMENEEQGDN